MLEKHSRITTDLRYGIEWYVTDEVNKLGIQVGTDDKEPQQIPAGVYYLVSIAVGEFDPEICDPTNIRKPIVIN